MGWLLLVEVLLVDVEVGKGDVVDETAASIMEVMCK